MVSHPLGSSALPAASQCKGKSDEGRILLATGPTTQKLQLFLTSEDLEIGRPPLELTEEIATFCHIEKQDHIQLLTHYIDTAQPRMNRQ